MFPMLHGLVSQGGGFVGPLDGLAITSAYALRRLRTDYAGNLIRLRRSSDDAESDFGFTGSGNLDTSAITTWLGGASGFVHTWYDQSGNERNATQSDTTRQPLYVVSGIGGRPSIAFDGTNDFLILPTTAITVSNFTVSLVLAADSNTGLRLALAAQATDGGATRIYIGNSATDIYARVGGNPSADFETSTLNYGAGYIHTVDSNGTNEANSWVNNGVPQTDVTPTNSGLDGFAIGAFWRPSDSTPSSFYDGQISEIVILPLVTEAERHALAENQGDYYGIETTPFDRQGVVLSSGVAWEYDNVYEPTVIYDSDPQILTGETNVYKLWYTGGWSSAPNDMAIGYAESADGLIFTKYGSNPVVTQAARNHVLKDGSTFYLYVANYNVGANPFDTVDLYTSSDGVTWVLDTAAILSVGAAATWDDAQIGNIFVWKQGAGDWRMMYEAKGAVGIWKIGYATATAPEGPWTKHASNPAISASGMRGGMWVYDNTAIDTYFYLWCHGGANSNLPTQLYRYRSTDLVAWVAYPAYPIVPRETPDEGAATSVGQIADPFLVIVGNTVWIYHDASPDGSAATGEFTIKRIDTSLAMLTGPA